jgi:nucleotide-binding universal stress UspA family protein
MKIQKILWAYDGSNESQEALKYAVFLAKKFGSEITGVYISMMHMMSMYINYPHAESEIFYGLMEKAEKNRQARLNSIESELATEGLRFKGKVLKGDPSKDIVGAASDDKSDLIVMGKRGHGLIDRMLVGSTTLRVLRESDIPVLAVKKRDEKDTVEINNILVPLDISEKQDSALNYAIELANMINANISVVYVVRLESYDFEIPYNLLENMIPFASGELSKRVQEAKLKLGIKSEIKTEVIQGLSPALSIVNHASNKDIDLIVISTHGRKGIKRLILGSVTEKVIQESHCSVLALKP